MAYRVLMKISPLPCSSPKYCEQATKSLWNLVKDNKLTQHVTTISMCAVSERNLPINNYSTECVCVTASCKRHTTHNRSYKVSQKTRRNCHHDTSILCLKIYRISARHHPKSLCLFINFQCCLKFRTRNTLHYCSQHNYKAVCNSSST